MAGMSDLDALVALLTTSVRDLQAAHTAHNIPFPSLDTGVFTPGPLDGDAAALQATAVVIAAAAQIIALVRSPVASVLDSAFGMYQAASVAVAERLHIAEILRGAGAAGLPVREIARVAGTANADADKLGRYLRYLATRHIFREVAPDVFANNRLSSCLDTGKSIAEIHADPDAKYEGPRGGFAAVVGHSTDDCLRGAPYMSLQLLSSSDASSQEPSAAPFSRACSANGSAAGPVPFFDWLEQPGNERCLRRFGAMMTGTRAMFPDSVILNGFDWKALKKGDVVIDVGGGIGSVTLVLARAFPELRFVVQDRPKVVQEGIKYFEAEHPAALASGQVSFQAHDFFTPQPAAPPAVFLLRAITHDWPTPYVKTILKHLRAAAAPTTRVVISDLVVPYAARADADAGVHAASAIPGAVEPPAPAPLLPNFGLAAAAVYNVDMQMLNLVNAQDRTVGQFLDVLAGTGWKLERIRRGPRPHLELSPILETPSQA